MRHPSAGRAGEPEATRQVRFCSTSGGVRVAYAAVGPGPALVVPAAWIGHLELAWQDPTVRAFYPPAGRPPDRGDLRQAELRAVGTVARPPHGRQRPGPGALGARLRRAGRRLPARRQRRGDVRTAQLADELGYEVFALAEGWGFDSTLVLAEAALGTRRIVACSGVLSVWGRTPATLAMTAATLHQLSGGRYVLGLGASTRALVEGFHGIPSPTRPTSCAR
jgi:Luciferase-like monooxygenase